ncbi:MAG: hypothetical protein ABFS56_05120 [Pseudomonadota bacterium]
MNYEPQKYFIRYSRRSTNSTPNAHFNRTPEDYELFLYTLAEQFPSVRSSTLNAIKLRTNY